VAPLDGWKGFNSDRLPSHSSRAVFVVPSGI
jgi:hypothetical protein